MSKSISSTNITNYFHVYLKNVKINLNNIAIIDKQKIT